MNSIKFHEAFRLTESIHAEFLRFVFALLDGFIGSNWEYGDDIERITAFWSFCDQTIAELVAKDSKEAVQVGLELISLPTSPVGPDAEWIYNYLRAVGMLILLNDAIFPFLRICLYSDSACRAKLLLMMSNLIMYPEISNEVLTSQAFASPQFHARLAALKLALKLDMPTRPEITTLAVNRLRNPTLRRHLKWCQQHAYKVDLIDDLLKSHEQVS